MPENAQLAFPIFTFAHRLNGAVHAEKLVIAGQNFLCITGGVVKEDVVFHQINEICFFTNTLEQCFHIHSARLIFGQAFPLMEMLEATAHRTDFRLHTVSQHHNSVMMEKVRHGIFIIGKILLIGNTDIPAYGLELHE